MRSPTQDDFVARRKPEWTALADILALMNGEIAADDFISGENVSDWVNANQPGGPGEHAKYAMQADELASRKREDAEESIGLRGQLAAVRSEIKALLQILQG